MAEIVATSIIGLLVEKIASGAMEAFQQLAGVKEEVERLGNSLLMIHAVLEDAEAKQLKDKAIQVWLKKVKDVAYDLDDLLDEMMMVVVGQSIPEEESTSKKPRFTLFSIPKHIVKSYNSFQSSQKFSSMISAIQKKLDAIAEDKAKYSLNHAVVVEDGNRGVREREETGSTPNVVDSMFYGREEDLKRIVAFLMDDSVDGCWPRVISIVGIGGLGKTTLAQLAFNTVREHFDKAMWVSVSDDDVRFFDVKVVASKIIKSTGRQNCGLSTSMDILERDLKEILEGQKFLLVLDDVWNANQTIWGRLRRLFSVGEMGSKIIVTTRNEKVAKIISPEAIYCLQGLSIDDCLKVFESRAFATGSAVTKTTFLGSIGKDIAKKCDGLPLAAEALGSLMYFKKNAREWEMVRDSAIWELQLPDNVPEILPSLRLSFNHLPARLKPCFAYCSIFPKHFKEEPKILVRLWMAEGLVRMPDGSSALDAEDIGLQYLDELISRSFLQKEDACEGFGYGIVKGYLIKMHDVMHDLARSIAGDECSTIDPGAKSVIAASSRFSLLINTSSSDTAWVAKQFCKAKALRSLYGSLTIDSIAQRDGQQGFLDAVFELKRLRALQLVCLRIHKLPVGIGNLKHLRYLVLWNAETLEELPPCIGDLINLQTLILKYCYRLCSLPESMGRLYNLSYLDLTNCEKLNSLPKSISDLINLRHLDLSYCHELNSLPESIGDSLINLRHLDLSKCIRMIQLPESISRLSNLRVLSLDSCESLTKLPTDIKNMKGLVHLDISSCHKLNCMPEGMDSLTHLQTLRWFDGSRIGELGNLKSLEGELYINNLKEVKDVAEAREARLREKQGLRKLTLSWGGLRSSGGSHDDDEQHQMVEEGVLDELRPPIEITELSIEGFMTVRNLPGWITDPLYSNLSELYLEFLARCETIPVLGRLPLLSKLGINNLGALRRIGPEFYGGRGAFPVLRYLWLSNLPLLEEWTTCIGGTMSDADGDIEAPFPSLEWLSVCNCPKLRALPSSSFPTLQELELYRLSSMEAWTSAATWLAERFPRLTNLTIGPVGVLDKLRPPIEMTHPLFSNLTSLALSSSTLSSNVGCRWIPTLNRLQSLASLEISNLGAIRCIGPGFYGGCGNGAFPSLKHLRLSGLESLEEWTTWVGGEAIISNSNASPFFSSLVYLSVNNCPKLRALPCSSFPALKELFLSRLPSLDAWTSEGTCDAELFPHLTKLHLRQCARALPPPSAFPAVKSLYMDYDDEALLASIGGGGFPSLEEVCIDNCRGREIPPEPILRRCNSIRVYLILEGPYEERLFCW